MANGQARDPAICVAADGDGLFTEPGKAQGVAGRRNFEARSGCRRLSGAAGFGGCPDEVEGRQANDGGDAKQDSTDHMSAPCLKTS